MRARHIQSEADFSFIFSIRITAYSLRARSTICVYRFRYHIAHLFLFAISAIHSDVCTKWKYYNSFMFYGELHTGRSEENEGVASKRDIKTSTQFTIEKNQRMQFHFVSHHILSLFTWLFICFFLFLSFVFSSAKPHIFLEILIPGKVDVCVWVRICMEMPFVIFQVKLSHTSHFVEISVQSSGGTCTLCLM